jgi:hypothetical protein
VTVVVQPPFYIPRPAEDQLWSKGPIKAPVIQFLTAQKMFGAAGQVPTKQWHYDYQETGAWQVTAETLNSAPIQLLTEGGKPFFQQWRYDYNESSHWSPAPETLNSFTALVTPNVPVLFYSPFYVPRPNDLADWYNWVLPHPSVSVTFTPPTLARQAKYDFNETSNWQWAAPATSPALQLVPYKTSGIVVSHADDAVDLVIPPRKTPTTIFSAPQASPFAALQWKPQSVDDWSVWQWQALRSDIAAIVTVGGQPPQKKWNGVYDYNDASHWFPWANRDLVIRTAQPIPVIPKLWPYMAYNEAAVTWQPLYQRGALLASQMQAKPFIAPFWNYANLDDPQMWLKSSPKSSTIVPLLGLRPNSNFWSWNYNTDESAIWRQPPQGLLNLPFPPPLPPPMRINPWWAWNIDERAVWWRQTPQRGFLSTAILPITGVPSLAFCVDIPVFSANALDTGLFAAVGSDSPSGQGWSGAGYMGIYEIDTDIQINGEFIDSLAGVYIDPTVITLFMLNPNGVTSSFNFPGTITRDSLGHFHQQLIPSVSGTWTYKWQATGAAICTSPDTTFTVKPSLLIPG